MPRAAPPPGVVADGGLDGVVERIRRARTDAAAATALRTHEPTFAAMSEREWIVSHARIASVLARKGLAKTSTHAGATLARLETARSGPKRAFSETIDAQISFLETLPLSVFYLLLTLDPLVPFERLSILSKTLRNRIAALPPTIWKDVVAACFPGAFGDDKELPPIMRAYVTSGRIDEPAAYRLLLQVLLQLFIAPEFRPASENQILASVPVQVTPPYVDPGAFLFTCSDALQPRNIRQLFIVQADVERRVSMKTRVSLFNTAQDRLELESFLTVRTYDRRADLEAGGPAGGPIFDIRLRYEPKKASREVISELLSKIHLPLPDETAAAATRGALTFRALTLLGGDTTFTLPASATMGMLIRRSLANDTDIYRLMGSERIIYNDERTGDRPSTKASYSAIFQRLNDVFIDTANDAEPRQVHLVLF